MTKTLMDCSCPPFYCHRQMKPLPPRSPPRQAMVIASHHRSNGDNQGTFAACLCPLICCKGGGRGADDNKDSTRHPPRGNQLWLHWRPKTIQRSRQDDEGTINGSESSQQSTNNAKWRCGGLRGDDRTRDEDTQTTITHIT